MFDRKLVMIYFIVLISMTVLAACGGGDESRVDQQQTDDSAAKQAAEDEKNRLALEKAKQTNVGPQLVIITPANGATVPSGPLLITWTATDDSGEKPMIGITIKNVDTGTVTSVIPDSADTGSTNWAGYANLVKGDYEIQLKGSDSKLSNVAFCRIKKP